MRDRGHAGGSTRSITPARIPSDDDRLGSFFSIAAMKLYGYHVRVGAAGAR